MLFLLTKRFVLFLDATQHGGHATQQCRFSVVSELLACTSRSMKKNKKSSFKASCHALSARGRIHKWFSVHLVNFLGLSLQQKRWDGKVRANSSAMQNQTDSVGTSECALLGVRTHDTHTQTGGLSGPPSLAPQLSQSFTTCLSARFARLPGGRAEVLLHLGSQSPESFFFFQQNYLRQSNTQKKKKNNVTSEGQPSPRKTLNSSACDTGKRLGPL